ncbi:hypothetical protein FPV67DRAFT_1631455 [Lyophyllum atratum]|nr:hypothetical protein FPV67DRAFT_1631455 [Lyophyllum atratum]
MPSQLALNCLIFGEDLNRVFTIEISDTKNVSLLKQSIKAENTHSLANISSRHLNLYKVSIPTDDNGSSLSVYLSRDDEQKTMHPVAILSRVFVDISGEHIHVIVKVPDTHPPSATPLEVSRPRAAFLQSRRRAAPSSVGYPGEFETYQAKPEKMIPCNRPYDAAATIPVTLLHPVFGQFKDDCEMLMPTREDNALVLKLQEVLSNFYNEAEGRAVAIRDAFKDVGVYLTRTLIDGTEFSTDGDTLDKSGNHRFNIAKFKLEVASHGAEPYLQASICYLESTREHAEQTLHSVLPCIIILIFGPHIYFAGAAWDGDRPNIQVLSAALSFHMHRSDTTLRTLAARHLGAYRTAYESLKRYYNTELPNIATSTTSPRRGLFPYPTQFTALGGAKHEFDYLSQVMPDKLLFHGKQRLNGDGICIKFSRGYSKDAHLSCASTGAAPKLLGFDIVPGGWFMVVMEWFGEDYMSYFDYRHLPLNSHPELPRPLRDEIRRSITRLHATGFVHGDIRDVNLLVAKNGEAKFRLVDFDWAGRIGEARYPMNIYSGDDLWRPDSAYDGEPITVEHDVQMMEKMLGSVGK